MEKHYELTKFENVRDLKPQELYIWLYLIEITNAGADKVRLKVFDNDLLGFTGVKISGLLKALREKGYISVETRQFNHKYIKINK